MKSTTLKLQACCGDQVLLLSVNILCLIKHLQPGQAPFQLFLVLPKHSFTNLLFKLQLPIGLPPGGENPQSIIQKRIMQPLLLTREKLANDWQLKE